MSNAEALRRSRDWPPGRARRFRNDKGDIETDRLNGLFLGAPYIERLRGNRAVAGALSAITAAVVGVILNLALWFALHAIFRDVQPFTAGAWHGCLVRFEVAEHRGLF